MVIKQGILNNNNTFSLVAPNMLSTPINKQTLDLGMTETEFKQGLGELGPYLYEHLDSSQHYDGIYVGYPEGLLYNRIWVRPREVDGGFIIADANFPISLWNAYQYSFVSMTDVQVENQPGTTLTYPHLPFLFGPMGELSVVLTILKFGPSLQSTQWKLTIAGVEYVIDVFGLRTLGLPDIHNWVENHTMIYKFETLIYQSATLKEQRRPLQLEPTRATKIGFLVQRVSSEIFFNRLNYGHDKVFSVPVYNEPIVATSIPQGGSTLTLTTDTTDLYDLNNFADYVCLIQAEDNLIEVLQIDSISQYSITTTGNVVSLFTPEKTTIFPVFWGVLTNLEIEHATSVVDRISTEFQEYKA
jgi:hypothetical protein